MNQSHFFMLVLSLLLLGLFSTPLVPTITGDVTKSPSFSQSVFEDYITFRAQQQGMRASATGVVTVDLPREPIFCTLEGEWITDNDPFARQRRYCDGANGIFSSYVDATQQYVVNDPNFFPWAGLSKPKVNPPAERSEGYVLHMYTCDSRYYQDPRYSVTAQVTKFSKHMEITWNYFDDDTQPAVDFFLTLTCELEQRPSFGQPLLATKEEPISLDEPVERVYYERVTVSSPFSEPESYTLYTILSSFFNKVITTIFA